MKLTAEIIMQWMADLMNEHACDEWEAMTVMIDYAMRDRPRSRDGR